MPKDEKTSDAIAGKNDAATHSEGTEIGSTAETVFVSLPGSDPATSVALSGQPPQESDNGGYEQGIPALSTGRYRIRHELGSGAMGTVRLAEDQLIDRQVAIKSLKSSRTGKTEARFLQETRIQAGLQHPNIGAVYDCGLDESGNPAIVMQYVTGQNLATIIDSLRSGDEEHHARFSLQARIDIFLGVIHALSYSHGKRLIHCDIKPSNVIIGEHGEVWLADWGLARAVPTLQRQVSIPPVSKSGVLSVSSEIDATVRNTISQEIAIIGTPRYMSPEQAKGSVWDLDEKSDIYSAFVLLFELLTLTEWVSSKLPLQDTLDAAKTRDLPHITDPVFDPPHRESIPTEIRYLLQKGLSRERSHRFANCEEVLDECSRIRNGKFAVRCPITFLKRIQHSLGRAIDRQPQLVIFTLLLAFAVWVLGLLGGWFYLFG